MSTTTITILSSSSESEGEEEENEKNQTKSIENKEKQQERNEPSNNNNKNKNRKQNNSFIDQSLTKTNEKTQHKVKKTTTEETNEIIILEEEDDEEEEEEEGKKEEEEGELLAILREENVEDNEKAKTNETKLLELEKQEEVKQRRQEEQEEGGETRQDEEEEELLLVLREENVNGENSNEKTFSKSKSKNEEEEVNKNTTNRKRRRTSSDEEENESKEEENQASSSFSLIELNSSDELNSSGRQTQKKQKRIELISVFNEETKENVKNEEKREKTKEEQGEKQVQDDSNAEVCVLVEDSSDEEEVEEEKVQEEEGEVQEEEEEEEVLSKVVELEIRKELDLLIENVEKEIKKSDNLKEKFVASKKNLLLLFESVLNSKKQVKNLGDLQIKIWEKNKLCAENGCGKVLEYFYDIFEELKFLSNSISSSKIKTDSSSSSTSEKNQKLIKKLWKAYYKCKKRISKLEETEVDWDAEENSSYILESKYKERATRIYKKICELTGDNYESINPLKSHLEFNKSSYPEINKALRKKFKDNTSFPDYSSVYKVIKLTSLKHNLNLCERLISYEAKTCFKQLGELLKYRRQRDLRNSLFYNLPPSSDPAENDQELKNKLKDSASRLEREISSLTEKYTKLQECGKEIISRQKQNTENSENSEHEEEESESDNSNYKDSDLEEEEEENKD